MSCKTRACNQRCHREFCRSEERKLSDHKVSEAGDAYDRLIDEINYLFFKDDVESSTTR